LPTWPYRYQLSYRDRLRRSVYEVLRDQMDIYLIKHAMVDSYRRFKEADAPYPFVPKRELKPRARVIERTEYSNQNNFLVLFCEGSIPNEYKKYIRFFDSNKLTKESIEELGRVHLHKNYTRNLRYFEHPGFEQFIIDLLPVDYALLIQQDQAIRKRNRYILSHFHVRIDWPVDEATQDMAQELRYISKELYESGEQYAQRLNNKLFERYGFHHVVGGRRTAAVVATQFLRKMDFISTIYAASSEGRCLSRLSERGVSKFVLIKLSKDEISQLVAANGLKHNHFIERYLVDVQEDHGVGILQVVHRNSIYSKPPEDGKLRKLRPDYQWLTISDQLLVPILDYQDTAPLPFSTIYSAEP
jgi:hypothetical protein